MDRTRGDDDDDLEPGLGGDAAWAAGPLDRTMRARARRYLDRRVAPLEGLAPRPGRGWARTCREVLGMSPTEVARRAGITAARVLQTERNERKGRVQLDTLGRLAAALDCRLVYAFVPRTSFEQMVLDQARRRAQEEDVRTAARIGLGPDVAGPLDDEALAAFADELIAARRLWTPAAGYRRAVTTTEDDVALVRSWLAEAERVVVLTGAGISTDSGIPDFRGPQGVWTKDPKAEQQATLQHYLSDPDTRRRAWRTRVGSPNWQARPNAGHEAITRLQQQGRLAGVITQNVDELHQQAGTDPAKVVEIHGTSHRSMCWGCGERLPMADVLERVRNGEEDPACLRCGGILKSDTISFGQQLDPDVLRRAEELAKAADVLLAVGTTLQVFPAAALVPIAGAHGARVVIINGDPTGMDDEADVVLRGRIGELLPAVVPA